MYKPFFVIPITSSTDLQLYIRGNEIIYCLYVQPSDQYYAFGIHDRCITDANGNFCKADDHMMAELMYGIRFVCRKLGLWIDLSLRECPWGRGVFSYYLSESYHGRFRKAWDILKSWNDTRSRRYIQRWRNQIRIRKNNRIKILQMLYEYTPFDPYLIYQILLKTKEYSENSINQDIRKTLENRVEKQNVSMAIQHFGNLVICEKTADTRRGKRMVYDR